MRAKNYLQKNIEIWSSTHPKEAVWLSYAENDNLVFLKTKKNEINLKSRKSGQFYHSPINAFQEAQKWFKGLNLEKTDVLYVYGIGLGYYYEAAKKWLENPDRRLVFLEDDIGVIYRFFETKKASEMLKDSQVYLYYFQEITDAEAIFNRLFWNFHMAKIGFSALHLYENRKNERYESLRYKITYDSAVKNSLLEEYLIYGAPFFKNFYPNLLTLSSAYLGNSLFGKFKNVPAIICGAGPSLEKNIHLLKSLGNKAIIFAGSSALNALAASGVDIHFGAGIDPNPAQEERLGQLPNVNFPFFYRNRIYPPALKLIKGPKLYITGSGGYEVAEWFERQLNIQGELIDEGRNVINFCLEIAYALGCNPIITVGADLAYTGDKKYAPGVIGNVLLSKEAVLCTESAYDSSLMKRDILGNPVQTLWKWVAESNWIADFGKKHPEITLINATEGGLGFPGVPNKSLKQVINKYLKKQFQIRARINKQIKNAKLTQISKKKVIEVVTELRDSLKRCSNDLDILLYENEQLKKIMAENGDTDHLQTSKAMLIEIELSEEPAFQAVLQIFNDVCSRLLERELISSKNQNEREKALLKLKLNTKKFQFLKNVCQVNIELIDRSTSGITKPIHYAEVNSGNSRPLSMRQD